MLLMSDEQKNKSELETAPLKMAEAFSEDEILNLDDFDIEYENPDEEGLFQSEQKKSLAHIFCKIGEIHISGAFSIISEFLAHCV